MHADLAAQLSPGARKQLGGTDLEYDTDRLEQPASTVPEEQRSKRRSYGPTLIFGFHGATPWLEGRCVP